MRIGVYSGDNDPASGGAYTLIESIRKDIVASRGEYELIFFFENDTLPEVLDIEGCRFINLRPHAGIFARLKRKASRIFGFGPRWKGRLDEATKKERIDLLWIMGPYDLDVSVPYVFTVWDLGHRACPSFPEFADSGWAWESREATYQKMLYKASYVIAGNEAGKREILESYPMPPGKIRVVPFPIPSFCFASDAAPEAPSDERTPYVMYPAQFWAHKNHIALVEAIRYLRDAKATMIDCYLTGADKGNLAYLRKTIEGYGLQDQVHFLGFVDDDHLRRLYRNALAMVFMSLLGPNNLPPLEAVALGCPVIISNLDGHAEQMGDAALFVDATDYRAVGEAIYALLKDPAARNRLVENGDRLAARYKDYSYFREMAKVFDEFSSIRNTWTK